MGKLSWNIEKGRPLITVQESVVCVFEMIRIRNRFIIGLFAYLFVACEIARPHACGLFSVYNAGDSSLWKSSLFEPLPNPSAGLTYEFSASFLRVGFSRLGRASAVSLPLSVDNNGTGFNMFAVHWLLGQLGPHKFGDPTFWTAIFLWCFWKFVLLHCLSSYS